MSVSYRDERIPFKTYMVLDQDPLPRFDDFYPYTGLDNFDDEPTVTTYDSIVVENEYLKMVVIPSLGARLFDLYDKVNGSHVFHHNEVIRPTRIGLRGAWVAIGMEFNSLHKAHHTPDNFSPVDYKVKRNDDGSVTAFIGNVNLLTNMYWLVGLTLRPGRQFIESQVKIYNSDSLYNRYYFWTNTAESVTDASRVFIPGKRTTSGPFPIFDGGDVSWYKNCKYAVDAFIIDCEEDFFGYYDYKMERGVVQHANHFVLPGKKRFTWGTSDDGLFWAPILSDKGIPYIELQSGRFRTQSIVEFADPHLFEEWKEWWYPMAKIGGISFANRDATVHVEVKPVDGRYEAVVGIYVTGRFPGSKIVIRDSDRVLEESLDLEPRKPFLKRIRTRADKVEVEAFDRDGGQIISWDCRDYRTKVDESALQYPAEFIAQLGESLAGKRNSEELWVDARLEDARGENILAELKYDRLLELDDGFLRGLCSLAVLHYKRGNYRKATELLEKAVKRDPSCADGHYYLGLCYLRSGDRFSSEVELWRARRAKGYFSQASHIISLIKMREKAYREAEKILREGIERDGNDLREIWLLSAALDRSICLRFGHQFLSPLAHGRYL